MHDRARLSVQLEWVGDNVQMQVCEDFYKTSCDMLVQ